MQDYPNLSYAESRYRAFKLAHRNRSGFLFGMLVVTLFCTWAIGVGLLGPMHSAAASHNSGGYYHQSNISAAPTINTDEIVHH